MAERLQEFVISRDETDDGLAKIRPRDFSMLHMLKILYSLESGPMTFTTLYAESNIRMKRSFLRYLHLCTQYNFVRRQATGYHTIYFITKKGTTMLNLFMKKAA